MVPFAGYELPVQFPGGIIHEHLHTRTQAGLFDVSHMGQMMLTGEHAAAVLERLVPADVIGLATGAQCYTVFTNAAGGIEDDLIVTRHQDGYLLVVNAARREDDLARLHATGSLECTLSELDRALIAIQGPAAAEVMSAYSETESLYFLHMTTIDIMGVECWVSRSGYTGEDGFEISLPRADATRVVEALLASPLLQPAGLGARDVLRLEAGLCLYGHDIDSDTTLAEAGLNWTVAAVRRPDNPRTGGFPGADKIFADLETPPARRRTGLTIDGRAVAREGSVLRDTKQKIVGRITSGTFSPKLNQPVAMAYIDTPFATGGTQLSAEVRGKQLPATVTKLPFIQTGYFRG